MIKNIEELITLMDAEAKTWRREDSEQKTVNGPGIKRQWEEQTEFPCKIYYMTAAEHLLDDEETGEPGRRMAFNLKGTDFNEDGTAIITEEQLLAQESLNYLDCIKGDFDNTEQGCDKDHIRAMLQNIVECNVIGSKAHRFIGWAQGVLCMEGFLPLVEAKDINRKIIEELYNAKSNDNS